MKVHFAGASRTAIFDAIEERLNASKIGSWVDLNLHQSELLVTVRKLGTSQLCFEVLEEAQKSHGTSTTMHLLSKKISWSHRALEQELAQKLTRLIEKSGGEVQEPYKCG